MSVQIQLHHSAHKCFTNLDFVTGSVFLSLPSDATISAINVKLEAESRTRLSAPKYPNDTRSDRKRTELEVHKLLYKVVTVFPSAEIQQHLASNSQYTLNAGRYEYPFSFKFPFNNDCTKSPSMLKELKMGQLGMQFTPEMEQHVKKTLPPSLNGFPGEAEIRYYIKATVVRPKFYQENLRHQLDIKFFPIEPPRPYDAQQEVFARRKQQFQRIAAEPPKRGLFRKSSTPTVPSFEPPAFQIDARLPNPPILTCNEPISLRVLVQQLNESPSTVILSTLQIELIGYTTVRAHDLNRTESGSWILLSQANMNLGLGHLSGKSQNEWKLPSYLWENIPLPNTVAPTFDTCNISRRYELEVRVGLIHSTSSGTKPELIIVPLRLNVQVFSGIAPPQQLLQAMGTIPVKPKPIDTVMANQPQALKIPPQTPQTPNTLPIPASPATPTTPGWDYGQNPAPEGQTNLGQHDMPDHAPPSYEDAMAENLAPVDGPRRDYEDHTEPGRRASAFNEKGGGLGRRVSERLFTPSSSAANTFTPSGLRGQVSPPGEIPQKLQRTDTGPSSRQS